MVNHIYNGSQLTQETVTTETTTDESTVTTVEVLYYAYDAGCTPLSVTLTDNDGKSSTYYYAVNTQGDVTAILTTDGTAVVEYTYDAWGVILTTEGTLAETLGQINPLRYRGYVYDNGTGYYYLQSRYYNPDLGRFLNADAYSSTGQGLLGNNMFVYCNNSPVLFMDSSGTRMTMMDLSIGGGTIPEHIYNQSDEPYGSMPVGWWKNVSYGGCGPVASYNAMIMLGNYDVAFEDILGYYRTHITPMSLAGCLVGTSPYTLCRYFTDQGYTVCPLGMGEFRTNNELAATADACIMIYFYGDSITTLGAHYVAFQQVGDVGYYYNLFNNSADVYRFEGYPYDLVSNRHYVPAYLILIYNN